MTFREEIILTQTNTEEITKRLQFSVPASEKLQAYVCLHTHVLVMVQGKGEKSMEFILAFIVKALNHENFRSTGSSFRRKPSI